MPDLSLSVIVIIGLLVLGGGILFFLITSNKSKDLDGRKGKKTRSSDLRKPTKQEKKLQIHAKQLIQLKRFVEAAQIYESIKMHRVAIDLLEENEFVDEAAATLLRMNLPNRAAVIYLRNGYFSNAAECFVKAGMYPEAAKAAHEGGDHKRAASLYEKAKLFSEAAKSYEKVGDYLSSARNLVQGKHIGFAVASYKQYLMKLEKIDKFSLNESDQLALLTWIVQGNFDDVIVSGLQQIGLLPKIVMKACQMGNMKHCAEIIALGDDYDFNTIISEINYQDHTTLGLADAFFIAGKYNSAGMIFEQLQKFPEAARAFEKAEAFERALYCFERSGDHGNAARVRPLIRKNKRSSDQFPQDFSLANLQSESKLNFAKSENTAQYMSNDPSFAMKDTTEISRSAPNSHQNQTSTPDSTNAFRFDELKESAPKPAQSKNPQDDFKLDLPNRENQRPDLNQTENSTIKFGFDLNDESKKIEKSSSLDLDTKAEEIVDSPSLLDFANQEIPFFAKTNGTLSINEPEIGPISLTPSNGSELSLGEGKTFDLANTAEFTFTAQPKNSKKFSLDDDTEDHLENHPEPVALDLPGEIIGFDVVPAPQKEPGISPGSSLKMDSDSGPKTLASDTKFDHENPVSKAVTVPFKGQLPLASDLGGENATQSSPQELNRTAQLNHFKHENGSTKHTRGDVSMPQSNMAVKEGSLSVPVADIFSECDFFSELSSAEIEKVWSAGHIISMEMGQEMVTGHRNTDGILVLLSGSLDCFKQDLSMDQFVGTLSEGDSFGELSVLAHMPTEIKLVSKYSCEIWYCDKMVFENFLQQNGKISTKLFRYYLLGVLHRISHPRKTG